MHKLGLACSAALLTALAAGCGDSPHAATMSAPDAVTATPAERTGGVPLVIGSVSDDPQEEAEVFTPFIEHVASELADAGVSTGKVVVTETVEEMADLLRTGEVDLFVDSVYGASTVIADGAGVPLLRRWKDGAPEYHSVIVVRSDSGITAPSQLRGRVVAFTEETSSDGFFLPITTLREQGLEVTELPDPDAPVAADRIGYVFSGDDENTVFQVLAGQVAGGALSEEDLAENAGPRAEELRVVGRTAAVPRHVVVRRTDLPATLVSAVSRTLGDLHTTPAGREVLAEFDGTARFDALSPAMMAPVLRLRVLLDDAST